MYVRNPNYAIALIIAAFYCISLSVPTLSPFTLLTRPAIAQQQCTSSTEGCLQVTKTVTGIDPGNIEFSIIVDDNNGNFRGNVILTAGQTGGVNLPQGTYKIREEATTAIQFDTTFSPECVGQFQITAGQTTQCNVTNAFSGAPIVVDAESGLASQNPNVGSAQLAASAGAQAGTTSGAGQTLGLVNPPFDTCFGNTLQSETGADKKTTVSAIGTSTKVITQENENELIRAPNAATYTAGGTIDLDDVSQALDKFGTRIITIQIYNDLKAEDPVGLAISAPQFKGTIMVEDSDGLQHEVVNFNLNTIRTECKYITVAKARGDAPNKNVFPLGVVGENDDVTPPEIKELLIQQQARLVTGLNQGFPTVLNPPFATCDTTERATIASAALTSAADDDFAIYSIRGEIDELGKVFGDHLNMEINVDLNINKRDLAKITGEDANNPYMRVNLVVDEDRDDAHLIPFTILDLWTDCKDLALNNCPLFEPIQTEIPP